MKPHVAVADYLSKEYNVQLVLTQYQSNGWTDMSTLHSSIAEYNNR